ncbi:MAG TPA: hypothetical protein VF194_03260 [Ferrovibrio sp.]|jgi:hypothetical protein|uniref:hypothetical protein n=1 Tax=Ferrovibrio sp. TaxID=1917215 RepID=UPI002ED0FA82
MKKLAIALIAAGMLGIGPVQAAPKKLTAVQLETVSAGTHYRLTGSLTLVLHSLTLQQYRLLLGH